MPTPTPAQISEHVAKLVASVTPRQAPLAAPRPTLSSKPAHDPTQHYIPPESRISNETHKRIAIIGGPGSGKTTSCTTFPNRIWLNFDRKLPQGEVSIDFWDSAFSDKLAKRTINNVVNTRDAFKFWLRDNHHKFHEEQTIILDSWTLMMNAFASQTWAENDVLDPPNQYYFYKVQLRYCREIIDFLKAIRSLVVVTFHESLDRDEKGELNGKVRPLMDGQFKDQLLGHFTDCWRQQANIYEREANGSVKRVNGVKQLKVLAHNNNPKWVWFWQLLGDTEFDTNCNPTLGEKVRKHGKYLIPADYSEILKIYQLP